MPELAAIRGDVEIEAFGDPFIPVRGETKRDVDRRQDHVVDLLGSRIVLLDRLKGSSDGVGHREEPSADRRDARP